MLMSRKGTELGSLFLLNITLLEINEIFGWISQSSGQFMDQFFENHGVYILSQHVEQKPVTHLGFLDDDIDALLLDQPEADKK